MGQPKNGELWLLEFKSDGAKTAMFYNNGHWYSRDNHSTAWDEQFELVEKLKDAPNNKPKDKEVWLVENKGRMAFAVYNANSKRLYTTFTKDGDLSFELSKTTSPVKLLFKSLEDVI
ncbi:MAG: hypothetical protein CL843_09365 [Crocinitomicaceae bacterium]|nr:hypothetical protein [Crocinitomicaceae bacterium]|tara:strand:+ start:2499 stop:2849 length:351 start_codon:yes stop_codon:yes gene_type:complete